MAGPDPKTRIVAIFYLKTAKEPPSFQRVLSMIRTEKQLELHERTSLAELMTVVAEYGAGVFLQAISDKDDLKIAVDFLSAHQGLIRDGLLRSLAFNGINHPRVPAALKARGCTEVLDHSIQPRALIHKLEKSFQIIDRNRKLRSSEAKAKENESTREAAKDKDSGKSEADRLKWVDPCSLQSDCWIIANKRDARSVLGRWLIEMTGPGPSAGEWEVSKLKSASREQGWEWKPRVGAENPFIKENGRWVFFGRQPEFVWENNKWRFVSKEPSLGFVDDDRVIDHRFRFEGGTLLVCDNSPQAQEMLPLIEATYDTKLRLEGEKAKEPEEGYHDVKGKKGPDKGPKRFANDGSDPKAWNEHEDDEKADDWNQHDSENADPSRPGRPKAAKGATKKQIEEENLEEPEGDPTAWNEHDSDDPAAREMRDLQGKEGAAAHGKESRDPAGAHEAEPGTAREGAAPGKNKKAREKSAGLASKKPPEEENLEEPEGDPRGWNDSVDEDDELPAEWGGNARRQNKFQSGRGVGQGKGTGGSSAGEFEEIGLKVEMITPGDPETILVVILLEYAGLSLTFDMPAEAVPAADLSRFRFSSQTPDLGLEFEIAGTLTHAETQESGSALAWLDAREEDQDNLAQLSKVFLKRQSQIRNFLKAAKGY